MKTKKNFWIKIIGEHWYNLCPGMWDSPYMEKVMSFVLDRYKNATIYPEQKNLFKVFRLTSPDEVKVIILGQDPYPDGSATGLAFANKEDTLRISPSLEKIHRAIEKESGMVLDFDITLEKWAKQGVLLLNTALTVEKYSPTSHLYVWEKFVQTIVAMLSLKKNNLHFCLWGSKAQAFEKFVAEGNFVHKCVHPAYASYKNIDWKCTHFTDINNILKEKIAW